MTITLQDIHRAIGDHHAGDTADVFEMIESYIGDLETRISDLEKRLKLSEVPSAPVTEAGDADLPAPRILTLYKQHSNEEVKIVVDHEDVLEWSGAAVGTAHYVHWSKSIWTDQPAQPPDAPFVVGQRVINKSHANMVGTIIEVSTANWLRVETDWLYDNEFDWRTKEVEHYYDQPQPATSQPDGRDVPTPAPAVPATKRVKPDFDHLVEPVAFITEHGQAAFVDYCKAVKHEYDFLRREHKGQDADNISWSMIKRRENCGNWLRRKAVRAALAS